MYKNLLIVLLIFLLCISCGKETTDTQITRNYAVEDITGKTEELITAQPVKQDIHDSGSNPVVQSKAPANLQADESLKLLLPALAKLGGFSSVTEPEFFVGQDLYEYINGGAELYHERGFEQVLTCEYEYDGDRDKSVIVDIYDMGSAGNADAIFQNQTGGSAAVIDVGQKGAIGKGELVFHQQEFFIRLTTFVDNKESEDNLKKVAAEIDLLIQTRKAGAENV